jgi:hypothetical protein
MKRVFVALAVLAISTPAVCASRPPPPEIWHGARSGMTRWQVFRAFSGAVAPTLPDRMNGELEGVVMPATLADHLAIVHFFFRGRGLSAVTVNFADVETGRPGANTAEAHAFADMVSQKYGPPDHCEPAGPAALVHYRCHWSAGPLHIHLEYRDGAPPTLIIAYRNDASEARAGL